MRLNQFVLCCVVLILPAGLRAQPGPAVVLTSQAPKTRNANVITYGLKRQDYAALLETLPALKAAVPVRSFERRVQYGEAHADALIVGTTPEFVEQMERDVQRGRFLTDVDVKQRANVVVVNEALVGKLFDKRNPVGRDIRLDDNFYTIVGVLENQSRRRQQLRQPSRPRVWMAISTMQTRCGDRLTVRQAGSFELYKFELSEIWLFPSTIDQIDAVARSAKRMLRQRLEDGEVEVTTVWPAQDGPDR